METKDAPESRREPPEPRIIIGIDAISDVEPLAKAGCHEFFVGVRPQEWIADHHEVDSPNGRSDIATSLSSFEELKELCNRAHELDTEVFLTLNAQVQDATFAHMMRYAQSALDTGVDGLIVADLALIMELRKELPNAVIHSSSLFPVLNSEGIEFLRSLGVHRIVLSRDFTLDEIQKLPKDIEYEVFLFNEGCKNIDAYCHYDHGFDCQQTETPACFLPYSISDIRPSAQTRERLASKKRLPKIKEGVHHPTTRCGACASRILLRAGGTIFKIVARGHPLERKLAYVKFAKEAFAAMDRETFVRDTQAQFRQCYGYICSRRDCYYPDVFEHENL